MRVVQCTYSTCVGKKCLSNKISLHRAAAHIDIACFVALARVCLYLSLSLIYVGMLRTIDK